MARRVTSSMQQASISEFFEKNKHFLGFDTLPRSIITAVKESVDNSLDAAEEHRILPEISVEIHKVPGKKDRLRLITQDNGPGIAQKSISKVFGSLLFGSRFHTIRQTRGQQGIGITGVVMYSQLTTGKPTLVVSKIAKEAGAIRVNVGLDTKKNKAIISNEKRFAPEEENPAKGLHWVGEHGLRIETQMKAKYQRGRQSVHQYLKMTSIVNPHASISFKAFDEEGNILDDASWPRVTEQLPRPVQEIKPHPHGLEIGTLQRLLRDAKIPSEGGGARTPLRYFLRDTFSSMSNARCDQVINIAGLDSTRKPSSLKPDEITELLASFAQVKLPSPPTDCLSPIEDLLIKKGLSKAIDSRFVSTVTREPQVTNGNPFQIEVGLIFGGDMPADQPIQVLRFANRVPLMYQQGGCLLTKALESVDWKRYGLDHPGGRGIPKGPAAVLIHLASTNVQFTSEAKEALADNVDVFDEIRKAMLEVGRGLRNHLKKQKQKAKAQEKFELVNIILPEIHDKAIAILDAEPVPLAPVITKIMNAVFLEEKVEWDKEEKVTKASVEVFNYTARPRAYTILSTWPEREGVTMVENHLGGRREAKGLWAWKLETLDPGSSTTVTFSVGGLSKGDWTEIDVFFRGAGDIIGATKIDEEILAEMLREEEEEMASNQEVLADEEKDVETDNDTTPIDEEIESVEQQDTDDGNTDWFGLEGE
ncbi:MAG: DNA topoisomerase VI subunit B [Candidatus Thermoplasmatota archaeon]|nr:DNA topoisomerase VI subunit B [Candidatus Thermoplasmatota archaeon]